MCRFIRKILELMLCNVQLILFFDIYNIIKLSKNCQIDVDASVDQSDVHAGATSTEREVQTELHPVPYRKDEGYVWNLWDLRRKAIELVSVEICCKSVLILFNYFSGKSSSQGNNFRSDFDNLSQI
jgi:hypothetical protein